MGTSTSSSGPGSGISFDPPWLDEDNSPDATDANVPDEQPQNDQPHQNPANNSLTPIVLAPPKRFLGAKRNYNSFLRGGSEKSLGKALGGYSRKGMGGSSRLVRRLQKSTSLGTGIYSLFQDVRSGTSTNQNTNDLIRYLSSGHRSTEEVKNAVIRHFLPDGGTLDEEASRNSLYQAMSELATRPNTDLGKLTDADIWILIEKFMVYEVVQRISIDLGQSTENKKFSPTTVVERRKKLKAYIQSVMAVEFEKIKSDNRTSALTSREMKNLLNSVLKETFDVFEGNL